MATQNELSTDTTGVPQEVIDAPVLNPQEFPRLFQLMNGEGDKDLQEEIARLLRARLRTRAERRSVKRTGRLRYEGYDEVVLIRDISASGVRMLVPADPPLDLGKAAAMTLLVKAADQVREIPLSLVRVIGKENNGMDLACRFLNPETENVALADQLRSLFYST